MPDFVKHSNGQIDYTKLFMGIATAILFLIQGLQSMHLISLSSKTVPRSELSATMQVNKDNLKKVLADVNKRLNELEKETTKTETIEELYHVDK